MLEINRGIRKTKKIQTSPLGIRKNWILSRKYCCFLEVKKRGKPWTVNNVIARDCTRRRNALISVNEEVGLKSANNEEIFSLE